MAFTLLGVGNKDFRLLPCDHSNRHRFRLPIEAEIPISGILVTKLITRAISISLAVFISCNWLFGNLAPQGQSGLLTSGPKSP